MKKISLALALLAMTAFAPAAFADTSIDVGAGASADSSSGSDASSNNSMTSNSRSVGLAGMAGGACSESATLGALGTGVGFSALNKACVAGGLAVSLGDNGIISKDDAASLGLSAMADLGYRLNYTGEWPTLSKHQRAMVLSCSALWNGKQVVGCAR